jgi:hypothetical protein
MLKPGFNKFFIKVFLSALLLSSPIVAQRGYKLEFGGNTGVSNYLGEIGGKQKNGRPFLLDLKFEKTRWNLGGYVRYKFHPQFAFKGSVNYLRIEGNDALSSNIGRRYRNLSFRNDIFDVESTVQWLFYSSKRPIGIYRAAKTYLTAYLFTGLGAFYHNPKALYQGSYIALQPLKTENIQYSRFGYCIPFGAGFFVSIIHGRKSHRIGLEINWRYTNTDYLDDVSDDKWINTALLPSATSVALSNRNPEVPNQPDGVSGNYGWHGTKPNGDPVNAAPRGNPNNKDSYISLNISYGVSLKGRYTKSRGKKIRTVVF